MKKTNSISFKSAAETGYPVGDNLSQLIIACRDLANTILLHFTKETRLQFVGRGSSGAMICALVGAELSKAFIINIIHVKKPGEYSHHDNEHITLKKDTPVIILDDFIRSGTTMEAILHVLPLEDHEITIALIDGATEYHIAKVEDMEPHIENFIFKYDSYYV